MDLTEFVERYRNVTGALSDRIGSDVLEDLLVYLDTGEEGLAVEFLMGNLLRRHIPVTRREAVELAGLLAFFEPPADRRDERDTFYATLEKPSQPWQSWRSSTRHCRELRRGGHAAGIEFDLNAEGRGTWRYLADPEMLDRMSVVDESS